ncbi:MAG: hypothetical protein KDI66_06040 [Xanthomonadales bacterium]|nr:hypothetical protein [Xanthomonadales bacterium]
MRSIILGILLLAAGCINAQTRMSLAVPYDGTSNNFVRLTYRSCEPNSYQVISAERNGAVVDIQISSRYIGGCPFTFSGTPTELSSYISLAAAIGDNVTLPSELTIRLIDIDGQNFLSSRFSISQARTSKIPIDGGCFVPTFPKVCIDSFENTLRTDLNYFPFAYDAPQNQAYVPGVPVTAIGNLHNNYALLRLKALSGFRRLPPTPVPAEEDFGIGRVAIVSPTEIVWQVNDEPSFSGRQMALSTDSDWVGFGQAESHWILHLESGAGIFGGFHVRFGAVIGEINYQRQDAQWSYPVSWDLGDGQLRCTPEGCDFLLSFSANGPQFLFARFPRGGLGLHGVYSQDSQGNWQRFLVRSTEMSSH